MAVARSTPQVRAGSLVDPVVRPVQPTPVGSAAWYRWLHDDQTTTFRFVDPAGSFTARKESRRWGDG